MSYFRKENGKSRKVCSEVMNMPPYTKVKCPKCGGVGYRPIEDSKSKFAAPITLCHECDGRGWIIVYEPDEVMDDDELEWDS